MDSVSLRPVLDTDLDHFYTWGRDPESIRMAAFTHDDPNDYKAFYKHWRHIRSSPTVVVRTILLKCEVVGHCASFVTNGDTEITYWVDRAFWGRGIATQALRLLLTEVTVRPIFARVASDNIGSLRVLEQCGFRFAGNETSWANGRQAETEEIILRRD